MTTCLFELVLDIAITPPTLEKLSSATKTTIRLTSTIPPVLLAKVCLIDSRSIRPKAEFPRFVSPKKVLNDPMILAIKIVSDCPETRSNYIKFCLKSQKTGYIFQLRIWTVKLIHLD
jgi:hypothetical protein